MSGFTDAHYAAITATYRDADIQVSAAEARRMYSTGDEPAVWFRPCAVWEVKGADFTLSPVHTAGLGMAHPSRGISMRFPRFLRVRDDKAAEEATSGEAIAELYQAQARKL